MFLLIVLWTSLITDCWDQGYKLIEMQKENFNQLATHLFSDFSLFMMGYLPEEHQITTYGKGEISSHLRVTAINGILNQKEDWLKYIRLLSETHGNINVHSVYWPSEGWAGDLYKCALAKSGAHSESTKNLCILWRQMIEEMGGIDGPGEVLHYAHSIGSVETYNALSLMTPREASKIKVITFGSPHLFPNEGFSDVTHYISYRDGVAMIDALTYYEALNSGHPHIIFLGDTDGIPLLDHFIRFGTYREKIEELGLHFISQYQLVL